MHINNSFLLFASAFLAILLISFDTATAQDDERLNWFKECITKCSEMNSECNNQVKDMWQEFIKNKIPILRHLRKCCLRGEMRSDSTADESFATCARIRCGAVLWG